MKNLQIYLLHYNRYDSPLQLTKRSNVCACANVVMIRWLSEPNRLTRSTNNQPYLVSHCDLKARNIFGNVKQNNCTWKPFVFEEFFFFPTFGSFYRFSWTFQFYSAYFAMDYVFLWNFEREIGVRLAKIDPLRMLDVWPLCYSSFDGSIRTYYQSLIGKRARALLQNFFGRSKLIISWKIGRQFWENDGNRAHGSILLLYIIF